MIEDLAFLSCRHLRKPASCNFHHLTKTVDGYVMKYRLPVFMICRDVVESKERVVIRVDGRRQISVIGIRDLISHVKLPKIAMVNCPSRITLNDQRSQYATTID